LIKVLHLSTFHLTGGAGIAAARLNRALNRNGVQSRLLVAKTSVEEPNVSGLGDRGPGKAFFWLRFVAERLFFLPYERSPEVRYAFSPAVAGKNLATHKLVKEADIIHLHWINFGFLSIADIARLLNLGKPVVWTLHDMWAFTGGCHHSGECDHFMLSCGDCKFLKRPDKKDLSYDRLLSKKQLWKPGGGFTAVACSRWLGRRAQSGSLWRPSDVTSIPNPLDTKLFRKIENFDRYADLGLAADKVYILFAAAKVSAKGKGFGFLHEALHILARRSPEAGAKLGLLVLGADDGGMLDDVPLEARFLGYISGDEMLVKVYNAASLYVTPSVEDNLPNTVMEAMACGTPVVGFRTGGIPEMIDHRVNGYVADYKSPESLAEGILWVLENNAAGALSEAARQKVLREYDEKVVAARYHELYKSLLSGCADPV